MKIKRYRVDFEDTSVLKDIDPDDTGGIPDKAAALELLQAGVDRLGKLQELLYASDRYSLLLIFQGMDAAGKDSAIKHVLSGVNPQGTVVHAFKRPSEEDLAHDFMWRAVEKLPARGQLCIFNRSYYEDVVVVRVHPELLHARRGPEQLITPRIWEHRYEAINAFEKHLTRSGTVIRKFYMHVSREEQAQRLLARLDDPAKYWKFNLGDIVERGHWKDYRRAWRDALAATSSSEAPWYVIPSDHKWFARVLIADIIVKTLEDLDLSLPEPEPGKLKDLEKARRILKRA